MMNDDPEKEEFRSASVLSVLEYSNAQIKSAPMGD
jgi:hypothetical protein